MLECGAFRTGDTWLQYLSKSWACIQHWYGCVDCRAYLGEPEIEMSTCINFRYCPTKSYTKSGVSGWWVSMANIFHVFPLVVCL